MNCQDARELFSDLLEAHIGLTERVPLEAHLRQCETCQQELEALRTSERPRPSAWRRNLDLAWNAIEGLRRADMLDRLRQRVVSLNRIFSRARPRSALLGQTLDVLPPAARISPRRRSVHARRGTPWWPRLTADLVRQAREAIGRIDIVNRLRRLTASLDSRARRLSRRLDVTGKALEVARESLEVAGRALEMARRLAAATRHRRRVFLHVRPRHLRLPATVILVSLTAVGIFRYQAELDVAVRRWVPSAPSSGEAPPPTPMASTEPATRPGIPQVSAPVTTAPVSPALDGSTAPPAPETPARVTAPPERMKGSSRPAEPVTQRRAPALSPGVRDIHADRPAKQPKVNASDATAAPAPPASRDSRLSLDVVGKLQVKSRRGAERDLAALLAKAGGTTVSRQRGEKVTVIEAVVPNPRYGKFAEGLTRIGSWQIEAGRSELPDPVRVTVRLAE